MKNKNLFLSICLLVVTTISFAQVQKMNSAKVGGTTTINASAALEVESTTKGFLPPRMTNAEMQAIVNPVDGLMVYNTTLGCLSYYKNGSYNCTHNEPSLPAPQASQGASFTGHFNGITSEVNTDHTLTTYTDGESFDNNTTCATKSISSQGCGGQTYVTGASGTVYNLVNINGQCWMQTNLREIPSNFASYLANSWLNTNPGDQGYWGYYNSDTIDGTAGWGITESAPNMGYLYQWNAAMNNSVAERTRGACPVGFHLPSDCEFMYLEHGLGMSISKQQLIQAFRSGAQSEGYPLNKLITGGSNTTNFSMFRSGRRAVGGGFSENGINGFLWSSSNNDTTTAVVRLFGVSSGLYRGNSSRTNGFSVRCLKD